LPNWEVINLDSELTFDAALDTDTEGNPHIAYRNVDGSSNYLDRLRHAELTEGGWVVSTVDYESKIHDRPAIAIDSTGRTCIAYCTNESPWELRYATSNGYSWTIQIVDPGPNIGRRVSLAIDSYNIPHIAYCSATGMTHAYWNGSKWQFETIEANSGSESNAICIGRIGKLHTCYVKEEMDEEGRYIQYLRYAWKENGSWYQQTIDSSYAHFTPGNTWVYFSKVFLLLDNHEGLLVSYTVSGGNDFIVCAALVQGGWIIKYNNTGTSGPIAFSPSSGINLMANLCTGSNYPLHAPLTRIRISYPDDSEVVSSNGALGDQLCFVIDDLDTLHIAYVDDYRIRYARLIQ